MGSDVTDLTAAWTQANGGSRDLNASNVNAFLKQLQTGGAYDPAAAYSKAASYWNQSPADAYAKLKPGYDAMAGDVGRYADAATSVYGKSMMDLAAQQSMEGRNAMEQRFSNGGTFGTDSGAARAALMQASMQPYAAADAQVAQTRAGVYSSLLNPMMQQAGQNYYSMGDRYAAQGNNYLNALSQLSQQAYVAPQFQTSPSAGSNALAGGLKGAAGGAAFGPWGALIGGGLGALGGYFS
jgi:hypothetical protein